MKNVQSPMPVEDSKAEGEVAALHLAGPVLSWS